MAGWVRGVIPCLLTSVTPHLASPSAMCLQRLAHRVANVLCWTLLVRVRQRETALRQRLVAEQQRQLQALQQT